MSYRLHGLESNAAHRLLVLELNVRFRFGIWRLVRRRLTSLQTILKARALRRIIAGHIVVAGDRQRVIDVRRAVAAVCCHRKRSVVVRVVVIVDVGAVVAGAGGGAAGGVDDTCLGRIQFAVVQVQGFLCIFTGIYYNLVGYILRNVNLNLIGG